MTSLQELDEKRAKISEKDEIQLERKRRLSMHISNMQARRNVSVVQDHCYDKMLFLPQQTQICLMQIKFQG